MEEAKGCGQDMTSYREFVSMYTRAEVTAAIADAAVPTMEVALKFAH
jgi:hypothetical protein